MEIYSIIRDGVYIDSLETLSSSFALNEQPGIETGFVGMATDGFKDVIAEIGLLTEEIKACSASNYVIVAKAESRAAFAQAAAVLAEERQAETQKETPAAYTSTMEAAKSCPEANLCSIAVPGEYALAETKKALYAGLHCVVFSNNVPLEDERAMKELAREKGLLCMGPDCGVANINGAALVLGSINNRGPFGICGASGVGIQHVAAILHEAGSGISQAIGTGGNDLKNEVGGIMMQMGIDVLEADPETKYLILISRKPGEQVLPVLLRRISQCKKPVVVLFMGCDREAIEQTGAIWSANLDDCAQKSLYLIGKNYVLESDEELATRASQAVKLLAKEQKYVRGAFCGGTFMDEAMHVLSDKIGTVYSNKPLQEEWKLVDSHTSINNTCIDYGEEEYTLGRPHPVIDPSIREPAILREVADPATAVVLLDFILTPSGHMDPCGYVLQTILKAQQEANSAGRQVLYVASVLGTDADLQDLHAQRKKLADHGVIVCKTNHQAASLAGEIIRQKEERDHDELQKSTPTVSF